MRISIIGPALPIPPVGWGAVESLIWDMKETLSLMGHEVQIVNIADPSEIINSINKFRPDFVHINYDDWVGLYPYIQYPCACTTHFAYLERLEMMGDYKRRVFDMFGKIKPNVFGLSKGINKSYNKPFIDTIITNDKFCVGLIILHIISDNKIIICINTIQALLCPIFFVKKGICILSTKGAHK